MAGKTNDFENAILNWIFNKSAPTNPFSNPAGWYVALSTTVTSDDNATGFTELPLNTNGYNRVQLTGAMTGGASGGVIVNNLTDIAFSTATPGGWGDIKCVAIVDHATNGFATCKKLFQDIATVTVNAGQQFVIPQGSLTITED